MSATLIPLADFRTGLSRSPLQYYHYAIDRTLAGPDYIQWFARAARSILVLNRFGLKFDVKPQIVDGKEGVTLIATDSSVSLGIARHLIDREINPTPWSFARTVPLRDSRPQDYITRAVAWLRKQRLINECHYQIQYNDKDWSVTFRFNTWRHRKLFGEAALLSAFQKTADDASNRQRPVVSLAAAREARSRRTKSSVNPHQPAR